MCLQIRHWAEGNAQVSLSSSAGRFRQKPGRDPGCAYMYLGVSIFTCMYLDVSVCTWMCLGMSG